MTTTRPSMLLVEQRVVKSMRRFSVVLFVLLFAWCSSSKINAQTVFYPGGDWYDTNGNLVQAVEGGIMKVGSLYYLWGMDRSQNNYTFRGVNLYSSPDLKTWTFVNTILSNASHPDIASGSVVERPKLLHNTETGQFVLWVHYEGWNAYATSEVGYATSSTIGGNYTWQGHFRPLGLDSKDMNVFKDTDGKAYMISSITNNSQVVIMELNASYTGHVREVYRGSGANTSTGFGCEGHALFKSGSMYYLIESMCSGWDTNDNRYYTATSLAGPWTLRGLIAPSGAKTYQSQVTNSFAVTGTSGTTVVFIGDRWSTGNYSMTRLILLPIQISGTTLSLPWYDQWTINTATGLWSNGAAINYSGEFRIVNRNSGKVMDVPGFSTANNALIKQYTWNGGANQRWTIQNLGRGEYRIVNVHSGKSLDNPNSSRTVGTNVQQYDNNGNFAQKWHIVACKGGYYRFVSVNTLGKTLGVSNASQSNSAGIVLSNFNFANDQQWQLVPATAARLATESEEVVASEEKTDTGHTLVPSPVKLKSR
ncbi:RICIN domain-containing protein [Pseudochryseolinea flava]|uniref:Beta-xylosidase n=1 Tax=Pseudochryseolinea flava TaxID=2059302 RepID=A0A364XV96_9BACT|nr:RICIN domain-containing protein [Pseudochryseolinea flava]RAV98242.1 beta-xylosidase [Pseudochryseolinea flava]